MFSETTFFSNAITIFSYYKFIGYTHQWNPGVCLTHKLYIKSFGTHVGTVEHSPSLWLSSSYVKKVTQRRKRAGNPSDLEDDHLNTEIKGGRLFQKQVQNVLFTSGS